MAREEAGMISGSTTLIAHIGYPTETFKAPLIYNPYFEKARIDAVVVPMGVKAEDYRDFLKSIFRLTNIRGALITMPHKVTTVGLLDECSTAVKVAGSCNAILRRADGTLLGDMFDGSGFIRGLKRSRKSEDEARRADNLFRKGLCGVVPAYRSRVAEAGGGNLLAEGICVFLCLEPEPGVF